MLHNKKRKTTHFNKTSFELLPEDLQGHISSYLDFKDVLHLQEVSSNLYHVKCHIEHIRIIHTRVNITKLCTMLGSKLKTLILYCVELPLADVKYLALRLPKQIMMLNLGCLEGVQHVAPYFSRSLKKLYLEYCGIDADMLAYIVPFIPKCLQHLGLWDNKIGVNGKLVVDKLIDDNHDDSISVACDYGRFYLTVTRNRNRGLFYDALSP